MGHSMWFYTFWRMECWEFSHILALSGKVFATFFIQILLRFENFHLWVKVGYPTNILSQYLNFDPVAENNSLFSKHHVFFKISVVSERSTDLAQ